MTKDIFAKGVSKAIPIIGGVISGGLTFASMKPMGNRLKETLSKSVFSYTEVDYAKDMDNLNKTVNAIEVDFKNSNEYINTENNSTNENTKNSLNEKLKEFKELLDSGIITESEFKLLKENLLNINFEK